MPRIYTSATPREQFKRYYRQRIARGVLRPGTQLPYRDTLACRWGIGTTTVSRAVKELVAEGILTTRRGGGVYVAENPEHRNTQGAEAS